MDVLLIGNHADLANSVSSQSGKHPELTEKKYQVHEHKLFRFN
ncbi:hypothetical protein C427_4272 [Paraglaciecola psychrophila 170]|uniref:Uncharacterized protein n=1 Tax=Paraglaciecola psychrophila 170 TaxID=1129794 RepID=K6ZXL6_9ALTE|nr:hypothetical protein C427_4272 [Paraglaciecola psychrophila 170]GAC40641.1 hypothetical protein GPSY_5042 [Paraglaciecola psychrophila 170]